jgi:hypothetical protein
LAVGFQSSSLRLTVKTDFLASHIDAGQPTTTSIEALSALPAHQLDLLRSSKVSLPRQVLLTVTCVHFRQQTLPPDLGLAAVL